MKHMSVVSQDLGNAKHTGFNISTGCFARTWPTPYNKLCQELPGSGLRRESALFFLETVAWRAA
jgi:hypothetical protein